MGTLDERAIERFAWLPVRLDTGELVHLVWYEAREVFEPDYGGVSTGNWVRVGARVLAEVANRDGSETSSRP